MNRQYGHIVYTRCSHPLSIRGTMQRTTGRGGFGIYSLTRDIAESEIDESLAIRILNNKRVASTDQQTVDFVYFVPDIGSPMLGRVRNRTAVEEDEAAQQDVDARGCYIGEWLVGDLLNYPCEYFDSPFYVADQRPIAAYYGDNPMPLQDPINDTDVPIGFVTREMAISFAMDGRQQAIRTIICELIHQFEQPAASRKFIVIRDTEPNMRLWIAAIEFCLPLSVAKLISFETSVKKIKETTDTGYYVQKTTGQSAPDNINDPSLERRAFNMVAGIDPSLFKGLTKDSPSLKNCPYLIVDGETREAWFETDSNLMKRSYTCAMFQDDTNVKGFCDSMGQMINIELSTALFDLYDAQMVIQDEGQWEYDELMKAISVLFPHFSNRSVLMLYLMDTLCIKKAYLQRFSSQDEQHGLAMFGVLMNLAERFELQQMSIEIYNSINSRFVNLLANPEASTQLNKLRNSLKARSATTYQNIIHTTVYTNKLSMIDAQALLSSSNAYAGALISIVDDYIKNTRGSWSRIFEDQNFSAFTDVLINKCTRDNQLSSIFINVLMGDNKALDYFVLNGSRLFSDNISECSRWWHSMMANNLPLEHLYRLISNESGNVNIIEDLLCTSLQHKGCSDDLYSLFNTYLARIPGTGERFLREWIKKARAQKDGLVSIKRVLTDISVNNNFSNLLTETLLTMDHDIILSEGKNNEDLALLIGSYSSKIRGLFCPNAALWQYLHEITKTRITRKEHDDLAQAYLAHNPSGECFPAPSNLLETPMGKAFVQKIVECREEVSSHVIALTSFQFNNTSIENDYINHLAEMVCKSTLKNKDNGIAAPIWLQITLMSGKWPGGGTDLVLRRVGQDYLLNKLDKYLHAIQCTLQENRTDNVSEKIVVLATKTWGKQTSERIEKLFESAQIVYEQKHKNGLLGKLFGGLFKK